MQWVVNGYVDSHGEITATGSGRVLLGLHQPEVIGNAAMILVQRNDELIAQAQKIVRAAGMRGFFSMDVKIDPAALKKSRASKGKDGATVATGALQVGDTPFQNVAFTWRGGDWG